MYKRIDVAPYTFGDKCCQDGCEGHVITIEISGDEVCLLDDEAQELRFPKSHIPKVIEALQEAACVKA